MIDYVNYTKINLLNKRKKKTNSHVIRVNNSELLNHKF